MSSTNSNTNANNVRAQTVDILRENMASLHQNIYAHNQIIRGYNENLTTMLEMLQSVRPVANLSLSNSMINRDSILHTPLLRGTGRYNNQLTNLLYSTIINGLLPYTETTEQQRLTPQQISSLTRDIPYTTDMSQTTCHICQEEFVENETVCQIIGCSHIFHKPELMQWLQTSNSCPICRLVLTTTTTTTEPVTERNIRTSDSSNNITNHQNRNTTTSREHVRNTTINNNRNQSVTDSNIDQYIENVISRFLTTTPTIDSSGTIVYTFDIPFNLSNSI